MNWSEQKEKIQDLNSKLIVQVERWVEDLCGLSPPMKSSVDKETGYKEPSLQDAVDLLAKCSTIAKQWIENDGKGNDSEVESDEEIRRKARKG